MITFGISVAKKKLIIVLLGVLCIITHKIVDDVLVEGAVVKVEQSIDCCPLLGVGWVETWLCSSRDLTVLVFTCLYCLYL